MDSTNETLKHIEQVRNFLNAIIDHLKLRAEQHDLSKLSPPEKSILDEYTPKLRDITYGSKEYRQMMDEMEPMIRHHHEYNRHHPEHFVNGLHHMNLIDIVEMLCDWKAATLRHDNGDIRKSIEINEERFDMDGQLVNILLNTIDYMGW